MCGLCGSFTQQGTVLSKRDRLTRARALEGLVIANQVRGTDSAGVAAIKYDGTYDLRKIATHPARFVNQPETQALLRTDAPLMIGHTRMTSMGNDVEDKNAHPFVEGNIIGAHNGIINNYQQLDHTVRVDSQAVFRMLDQFPDEPATVMNRVNGSCALSWYDMRDPEALYLVAHSNPLAAAIVPRINTVFWSSVDDHLESVMRVAYGTSVNFINIKPDTIYRLDANDIYQWQEEKVDFGMDSYFRSGIRVYDHGGYGWDDEEREWGYPKSRAQTPTASTAALTQEEEERYEEHWNRLVGDNSQSESDDDFDGTSAGKIVSRLHDQTNEEFLSGSGANDHIRFEVDDLDGTIDCGYCDRPLGDKGVWDDGLQLLLCRYCQNWWDNYGQYIKHEPTTGEIMVYNGGKA